MAVSRLPGRRLQIRRSLGDISRRREIRLSTSWFHRLHRGANQMKMRIKVAVGAVIALAATSAIGTAALATPPSGPPQFESLRAPFKTPAGATTGDPVTTGTCLLYTSPSPRDR